MGAVTRFPIPLLVAIAYVVVLIFLFNAALPGATVVLVLVGIVVVMPYLLMAKTLANNRRFNTARSDLMPGEELRFWWKAGLLSFGERWVIVTTDRLVIPKVGLLRMRTRSIPFAQIYLADTSERSIGVGAYGGGLVVGTTLSSRYLELDLVDGSVVRIRADRPQVLRQRLIDAITEWSQRQSP